VVFGTSPNTGGVVVSNSSPSDTILDYSLPPLHNDSAGSVRLRSVRLISPSGPAIRVLNIRAYPTSEAGLGWMIGFQGDLTRCPGFRPRPVSAVVIAGRSEITWIVVISFIITQPGQYHSGRVRLDYVTNGHAGWQIYYFNDNIEAVSPKKDPNLVQPSKCK
jgi:hypothetical protein